MRIGIVIGRIGGIDGVALETEKWIEVLKRMGHQVEIITGRLESHLDNVTILPELCFFHDNVIKEQDVAFLRKDEFDITEKEFMSNLKREAEYIEVGLLRWISEKKIQILISENASALPCHLSMGLAVKNVIQKTKIPTITHDHDFPWERGDRYLSNYPSLNEIVQNDYPLDFPNVSHAVINTAAKRSLMQERGIESIVVPNVMDFDIDYGYVDSYNQNLLENLGFNHNDVLLFQITRIVRRKGIETAIELIERINDERAHLIITGSEDDDNLKDYISELHGLVKKKKLNNNVHFLADRFTNVRPTSADLVNPIIHDPKQLKYSLSDAYAHARACTYFSRYEGFGNAFVECVLAKKPIFVNNYQPVYWEDIGSLGFKTVQIEDNELTDKAVDQIKEIIFDKEKCKEIGAHNFELGKKHFSYQVLEGLLKKIIHDL